MSEKSATPPEVGGADGAVGEGEGEDEDEWEEEAVLKDDDRELDRVYDVRLLVLLSCCALGMGAR